LVDPAILQLNHHARGEVLSARHADGSLDPGAIAKLDAELPLYGTGALQQMLGFAFFQLARQPSP